MYQQCIIRKKEKIRLESTHTDILLIKLKKKINFQLVCKLTHAYLYIFMHSAIQRLTYMYAIFIPVSCARITISILCVSYLDKFACTIRVSVKIMSNTLIEFQQNSSKRKALPLSWQIKVEHLSP